METENDNLFSFEKNLTEKQQSEAEQKRRLEAIRVETYNRLKNDPEVLEFLKPYNSLLYDGFLQQYASGKSIWVGLKDYYKEQQTENELQLLNIARMAFSCLLKKKMRDLRREWGAGSIELPGMNTPFDFMLKVDDIFTVDWVPPIDEADLNCLQAYVAQHEGYDFSFAFQYESDNFSIPFFMEETFYESEDSFACFHNSFTGTENLKVLPDKRGEKFMFYIRAYNMWMEEEKQAKIARGELPPEKELDTRPFPPSDKSWFVEQFIQKFDDRETLNNYRTYKEFKKNTEDEDDDRKGPSVPDQIEDILNELEHLKVVLPVKANADWRLALIESWNDYRKKSVTAAIRQAYDDYLFHVQTGISFQTDEIRPETLKKVDALKERFLGGRELLGEPRDFDI